MSITLFSVTLNCFYIFFLHFTYAFILHNLTQLKSENINVHSNEFLAEIQRTLFRFCTYRECLQQGLHSDYVNSKFLSFIINKTTALGRFKKSNIHF